MKLRKGDEVVVIAGKHKGKKGVIESVLPKDNKVIVQGVNTVKRHTKARSQTQQAGIIEKELPIDASNVMLLSKGKPTRVGFKVNADGTKVRVAKKTGEEV
ncbi:MAG: ribosomal protein [Actinomycetota bacterium]|jgi:large subunit ribosomal protein L24